MEKGKRSIVTSLIVLVLGIFGALIVLLCLAYFGAVGRVDIINRDGIAYIQYLDQTCMLLDENGKQVPFNSTINAEHPLRIESFTMDKTSHRVTVVYDTSTNKYYISIGTGDDIPAISIMYNENLLEQGE